MNDRQHDLRRIRPEILSAQINDNTGSDERFQNLTIRPIVKLQSPLIVEVFKNYIIKHKGVYCDLSLEKRMDYIENTVQRDMKFRNALKGMIIGLFTIEEYKLYIQNSSALNKRMMSIVKERLLSNIQLFEKPEIRKAV